MRHGQTDSVASVRTVSVPLPAVRWVNLVSLSTAGELLKSLTSSLSSPIPSLLLPCIASLGISKKATLLCYQLSCNRVNWEASLNHSRCRFTEKFISDYRPGLPPKWEKPAANLNLSEWSCLVTFIAGEDKVMIFYFYFTLSRQIY